MQGDGGLSVIGPSRPPARATGDRALLHFDHIDGLRAVAILAVIGFHALPDFVPGGFVGVDIFFVISGFLITRLIVTDVDGDRFSLIGFFARRARRLLPAAATVYAVSLLGAGLLLLPDAFREFGVSLGGASLIYANREFYKLAGYFEAPAHEKPLLHTWSLSIEEQFYLLWPVLLLVIVPRLPRRVLLVVTLTGLLASLCYAQYMLGHDQRYAFYMLQTRAWELLLGAMIALLIPMVALSGATSEKLAWLGAVLICGSVLLLSVRSPFPGFYALPACAGTASILFGCGGNRTSVSRMLSFRPMVFIGLISYSLYLWHWPMLSLAHYAIERPPQGAELVLLLLATALLATLSWALVERPFRTPGGRLWLSDRKALIVAGLTMGLFAAIGRLLVVTDGLPGRLDRPAREVFAQKISQNPKRQRCENVDNAFGNETFCNLGRPKSDGDSYEVVIIGDSQADHFVPAFASQIVKAGLSGRQLTQNGCGPVIGLARAAETSEAKYKPCPVFQESIKRFVEANPALKLVILSTFWPAYEHLPRLNGVELPRGVARPDWSSNPRETLERYLRAMVSYFDQRGIRILLIGGLPPTSGDLPMRCAVKAHRAEQKGRACEVDSGPILSQLEWSNAMLRQLATENPRVKAVLPSEIICADLKCAAVMDGTFLYFDRGHLNAAGSTLLGKFMLMPELDVDSNIGKSEVK